MLVSNFEILVKRIAPSIPGPVGSVYRRVIQGYFLTISNLEPTRSVTLYMKMTTPNASGNRAISSSNIQCFFDNGPLDNGTKTVLPGGPIAPSAALPTTFRSFTLKARETCLLAVLPIIDPMNLASPDTEIRGYVEIFQSRSFWKKPSAQLLVTPEYRGTFLDNEYPANNPLSELDFDQLAYSVPLASGQALNTVEAVRGIIWDFDLTTVKDIQSLAKTLKVKNPDLDDLEINEAAEFVFNMKSDPDFLKQMKGK